MRFKNEIEDVFEKKSIIGSNINWLSSPYNSLLFHLLLSFFDTLGIYILILILFTIVYHYFFVSLLFLMLFILTMHISSISITYDYTACNKQKLTN